MKPADTLLQQLIDGEADGAQAAAAERLMSADPALGEHYKFLSDIDLLAKRRARLVTGERTAGGVVTAQIMDALPTVRPSRRVHVEIGTAVATLLVSSICAAAFGVAGTMDDLLPLSWMALASIVGGLVIVVGLGRFRGAQRDEDTSTFSSGRLRAPTPPGLLQRLLGLRFALGDGERLLYRAVGCILFIGGCYLALKGLA